LLLNCHKIESQKPSLCQIMAFCVLGTRYMDLDDDLNKLPKKDPDYGTFNNASFIGFHRY
jgi:hypothetical protein